MGKSSGNMEILTPGRGSMGWIRNTLVTFLIVVAIVMVTLFFAVRTEGGRAFVADRLGKYVGTEIAVDKASIGWPYALVVEGPATTETGSDKPGFRAQSLRISFNLRGRIRLEVHRGELLLVQDSRGEWSPAFFGRMGDLPFRHIGSLERVTAPFRDRVTLQVSDSAVRWVDNKGKETASVAGLYFRVQPVRIPEHRMSYCRLSLYSFVAGQRKAADVEREWLMSESNPCLPLAGTADDGKLQADSWFLSGAIYDQKEAGETTH